MSSFHKFFGDNKGAALVEFTIMLPVLFGMVFGLIEFGRYFHQKHAAEKGVKAAARYVARTVDRTGCPPVSAAYNSAVTQAQSLAIRGSFDNSATPTLSNWTAPSSVNISVACTSNAVSGGTRPWRGERDNLPIITVSTQFDYDAIGFLNFLGLSSLQVNASHQELFIGG